MVVIVDKMKLNSGVPSPVGGAGENPAGGPSGFAQQVADRMGFAFGLIEGVSTGGSISR
jgi:hypothetical protein